MTHYDVLGIDKDATDYEIKQAYEDLTIALHPDKYQGDVNYAKLKLVEVEKAYKVLKEVYTRCEYDNHLYLNCTSNDVSNNKLESKINCLITSFDEKCTSANKGMRFYKLLVYFLIPLLLLSSIWTAVPVYYGLFQEGFFLEVKMYISSMMYIPFLLYILLPVFYALFLIFFEISLIKFSKRLYLFFTLMLISNILVNTISFLFLARDLNSAVLSSVSYTIQYAITMYYLNKRKHLFV